MNPIVLPELPFVGYEAEKARLVAAVRQKSSALLIGPRFSGKTRLVRVALSQLEDTDEPVWIDWPAAFRILLEELTAELVRVGYPQIRSMCNSVTLQQWARTQTSVRLRGLIWTALEQKPRTIVLENVSGCSAHAYRFLQRVCATKHTNLVVTTRDFDNIGDIKRLIWDPRSHICLRPLARPDARSLFNMAVEMLDVTIKDEDGVREEVLRICRGNPGYILEMCRLASQPQYRSGENLKLHLMRIDLAGRLRA